MLLPILDEDTHTYRMPDGRVVPGLTAIMRAGGLIDDTYYTEAARQRGTAVHAAIHYYLEGTLDESTIDPRIAPYFQAYLGFLKLSGFMAVAVEKVCYCRTQDYACKIDQFGIWPDGTSSLLELKTGSRPKWVDIQLAAQQQACFETGMRPTRLYSLELRANGSFDLKEHKAHDALHFFLGARQLLCCATVDAGMHPVSGRQIRMSHRCLNRAAVFIGKNQYYCAEHAPKE